MIGEVPVTAHDPLLHKPGVGPYPQHFQIVVRFPNQAMATPHMMLHQLGDTAEVGHHADLDPLRCDGKRYRLHRIVWNREGRDLDVAYGELLAGRENLEGGYLAIPIDGVARG